MIEAGQKPHEVVIAMETERQVGDRIMRVTVLPPEDPEEVRKRDDAYFDTRVSLSKASRSGLISGEAGLVSTGWKRSTLGGPSTGNNY